MHRIPLRRARPSLQVDACRAPIAAARRRHATAAGLLLAAFLSMAGAPRAQQPSEPPATPGVSAATGAAGGARLGQPRPSPTLTPEQVVAIQLDALQHNDTPTPDFGIETTRQFASPTSSSAARSLPRFADAVQSSVFRPMVNHRRVERGPMHVEGDRARQRVTVVTANGSRIAYMFLLSRQRGGECDGCWMTDGVARLNETGPRADGLRSA
jgi:Domain of unknown function (DUF4864)